jgi:imidazolonepropionase-like amidohydrolase
VRAPPLPDPNALSCREVRRAFFVEAGASTAQALAAATSRAAQACGVGDTKGRLRPGYDADILVVDGDLSTDVGRLRGVRAVLRKGLPIS